MAKVQVPNDRKYTKDHEWARSDAEEVTVGITAFAVEQLGDITLVSFDVAVGDRVVAGKTFGTIESVKTLSDLYAPLTGVVTAVNAELFEAPEVVNDDPWDKGWMIKLGSVEPSSGSLLEASAYAAHVEASEH